MGGPPPPSGVRPARAPRCAESARRTALEHPAKAREHAARGRPARPRCAPVRQAERPHRSRM